MSIRELRYQIADLKDYVKGKKDRELLRKVSMLEVELDQLEDEISGPKKTGGALAGAQASKATSKGRRRTIYGDEPGYSRGSRTSSGRVQIDPAEAIRRKKGAKSQTKRRPPRR